MPGHCVTTNWRCADSGLSSLAAMASRGGGVVGGMAGTAGRARRDLDGTHAGCSPLALLMSRGRCSRKTACHVHPKSRAGDGLDCARARCGAAEPCARALATHSSRAWAALEVTHG